MVQIDNDKLDKIRKDIAGDIIESSDLSSSFKKWRNIFDIGQRKLASTMGVKVSMLSDYENGRRENPNIKLIRAFVKSLIQIDIDRDYKVIRGFVQIEDNKGFLAKDFKKIVTPDRFFKDLSSLYDLNSKKLTDHLYGVTYVETDAIKDVSYSEYAQIFGKTNKRVLYFSKTVDPLIIEYTINIAKYLTGLYPSCVIIHDLEPSTNSSKYSFLKFTFPIFLVNMSKEDIQNVLKY